MQLSLHRNCLSTVGPVRLVKRRVCDQQLMAAGPGPAKTCIVGLGDPIVDILVRVSARNFDQLGLERGGSVSLPTSEIDDLLEQVADDGHRTRLASVADTFPSGVPTVASDVLLIAVCMGAVQLMY